MPSAKEHISNAARGLLRTYIRYAPWSFGKARALRIIEHYFWRPWACVVRTRYGTRHHVASPDLIQSRLYYFGVWEPVLSKVIAQRLKSGDIFVDVGANIGYYSLLAAARGCQVWAIEALPSIHAQLLANIATNSASVHTVNMAVHKERTSVRMYRGADHNLGMSSLIGGKGGFHDEAEVAAAPLGLIVPPEVLLKARLIKIDVEGAEWLVFAGVRDLLAQFPPETEWLIEINPQAVQSMGGSVAEIFAAFSAAGYRMYQIPNDYGDEVYLRERECVPEPIAAPPSEQMDILFSKA